MLSPSCFENSIGEEGSVGLICPLPPRTLRAPDPGFPYPGRFDGSGSYSFLSSPSLGRSTYMEKYVYIYR